MTISKYYFLFTLITCTGPSKPEGRSFDPAVKKGMVV
jgi:hypothetical protein